MPMDIWAKRIPGGGRLRRVQFWAAAFSAVFFFGGPLAADQMKIGTTPSGHLIWIADELGYFRDAGADVDVIRFSSGVTASRALVAAKIDLATSSEFAFVSNILSHPDLRVIAGIARSSSVRLFARKDRGIRTAADLVGRPVAVTRDGIGEFFLGEHLSINGVDISEIELVDLRPLDVVDAIAAGNVDAAITWEPFVHAAAQVLGDNFYLLPEQDSYYYHFLLQGKRRWIDANRRPIEKILSALLRAQEFAADDPSRAQALIAKKLDLDLAVVRDTWGSYVLEVTLLQTLLGLMEREALWLVENGHATFDAVPNFLDVIDNGPLRAAAPSADQLIR